MIPERGRLAHAQEPQHGRLILGQNAALRFEPLEVRLVEVLKQAAHRRRTALENAWSLLGRRGHLESAVCD